MSLVHVRYVVLWERACLRVYDLCVPRTGMPSFRKMLVILWFRRSGMYGRSRVDGSGGALFGLYCLPDIIQANDVIKHVLVLYGCSLCEAPIFDTFPLIANEVDL